MPDAIQETWQGHVIHIYAIPVRDIETRMFAPEAWIAILRIERNGNVLADWHLPRFAGRWASAAEAQRDALEYATKLVSRGVPGTSAGFRALSTGRRGNVPNTLS